MKVLTACLVMFSLLACIATDVPAREKSRQPLVPYRDFVGPAELPEDHVARLEPQYIQSTSADTFCLVWFDFETADWQGWKTRDMTAERDTFFHVDDFSGLGGGAHGRLVPIEGTKSAWCGIRAGDDFYACNWINAPGYGNSWDQALVTDPFTFTSPLEFSYHGVFDSEEEYDFTYVEYLSGEEWHTLCAYDGVVDTVVTHTLRLSEYMTKLRFHFQSDGHESDEDGRTDTDGACIIDSITVSDAAGLIHFEDFESVPSGAMGTDFWNADVGRQGYGDYSGIASNLQDLDPCAKNITTQMMFFNGSDASPSPDYPGLPVTPFCKGGGGITWPCQSNRVQSPPIDMSRYSSAGDEIQDAPIPPQYLDDLGGMRLVFTVYRDMPMENLVFYAWNIRRIQDGCPDMWEDQRFAYSGAERAFIEVSFELGSYVGGNTEAVMIELDVMDMCSAWYGIHGDCAEHTPSPYFDNIRLYRYTTAGPQWSYEAANLFQDNFPSTDDLESYVRADMASDIARYDDYNPVIDPGDSIVVRCAAPNSGGLDTIATGEERIYFHCNVSFHGPDGKPDLFGPQLEGTYGTYVSDDGDWTVFLMERARASYGWLSEDRYCVDLNDSLFTRGYMVEYYFKAFAIDGTSATLPDGAETIPPYAYPSARSSNLFEFTCLPLMNCSPGYGTLYVDDFDGRGTFQGLAQTYYDPSFDAYIAGDTYIPDRYDVNQPSSMVGNSLGSRARLSHLQAAYTYMIWDSGDLSYGTLISSESTSEKSDDIGLLVSWLDSLNVLSHPGLIIMGDNVATDLGQYSDGLALMEDWFGTSLMHSSFYELTGGHTGGGILNPLVTGTAGISFYGLSFYLAGGCPVIEGFDVLQPVGHGIKAIDYPGFSDSTACASVLATRQNSLGANVYTGWMGFSLMRIRNSGNGTLARNEFLKDVFRQWLIGPPQDSDITESEVPAVTALTGIFPNPFNPVTRVSFSLKEKGPVSMRVYDVSGRLVCVLVDEVREAGSYEVLWDGTNNAGRSTASGIYFCRMETDDYQRTVKMVLLR